MALLLLDNHATNTPGAAQAAKGSSRTLVCWGNFGGGTVNLEISPDRGTTWITNPDLTFTENSVVNFTCGAGLQVRGTLSGSTGASVSLLLQ